MQPLGISSKDLTRVKDYILERAHNKSAFSLIICELRESSLMNRPYESALTLGGISTLPVRILTFLAILNKLPKFYSASSLKKSFRFSG
jgi:hypothetical protein